MVSAIFLPHLIDFEWSAFCFALTPFFEKFMKSFLSYLHMIAYNLIHYSKKIYVNKGFLFHIKNSSRKIQNYTDLQIFVSKKGKIGYTL